MEAALAIRCSELKSNTIIQATMANNQPYNILIQRLLIGWRLVLCHAKINTAIPIDFAVEVMVIGTYLRLIELMRYSAYCNNLNFKGLTVD